MGFGDIFLVRWMKRVTGIFFDEMKGRTLEAY